MALGVFLILVFYPYFYKSQRPDFGISFSPLFDRPSGRFGKSHLLMPSANGWEVQVHSRLVLPQPVSPQLVRGQGEVIRLHVEMRWGMVLVTHVFRKWQK